MRDEVTGFQTLKPRQENKRKQFRHPDLEGSKACLPGGCWKVDEAGTDTLVPSEPEDGSLSLPTLQGPSEYYGLG